MIYRNLGGAGLKVSEISLGTWLSCDSLSEKEASCKIIHKTWPVL
jgi:aryl-alcohol dehydrogenase-like predicted oxidoreductase